MQGRSAVIARAALVNASDSKAGHGVHGERLAAPVGVAASDRVSDAPADLIRRPAIRMLD
jgi:hypothetical protein